MANQKQNNNSDRKSSNASPATDESIVHVPSAAGPHSTPSHTSERSSSSDNSSVHVLSLDHISVRDYETEYPELPPRTASATADVSTGTHNHHLYINTLKKGKRTLGRRTSGLYSADLLGHETPPSKVADVYVKAIKVSDRALINSSFKFENSMRDLVLYVIIVSTLLFNTLNSSIGVFRIHWKNSNLIGKLTF